MCAWVCIANKRKLLINGKEYAGCEKCVKELILSKLCDVCLFIVCVCVYECENVTIKFITLYTQY